MKACVYLSISLFFFFGFPNVISAQLIEAEKSSSLIKGNIASELLDYNVVKVNLTDFRNATTKSGFQQIDFTIDQKTKWKFELRESDLLTDNTFLTLNTPAGKIRRNELNVESYIGNVLGDPASEVVFTLTDNSFFLSIQENNERWMIEPAVRYDKNASREDYVFYNTKNIAPSSRYSCGHMHYEEALRQKQYTESSKPANSKSAVCQKLELSSAIDYSLVQSEGSIDAAVALVVNVMALVSTDYDDSFSDEIQIELVEIYASTCASCDPWTSSTDALLLLADFGVWGEGGGFSRNYDLAALWSARDYNDGFAGLAYVGTVCTTNKYAVLSRYTSNINALRVMTSHEIGHSFNCGHNYSPGDACDGNPGRTSLIMDPAVDPSAAIWADGSYACAQNSTGIVNAFMNSLTCLNNCNNTSCSDIYDLNITSFYDGYVAFDWGGSASTYRIKIRKEGSFSYVLETTTNIESYNWFGSIDDCQKYVISVNPICAGYEGMHISQVVESEYEAKINLLAVNTLDCDQDAGTYTLELDIEHWGGNSSGIDIDLNGTVYNRPFGNSPQKITLTNLPSDNIKDAYLNVRAANGGGPYCDAVATLDIPGVNCDLSIRNTFNGCALPSEWVKTTTNSLNFSEPYEWKFQGSQRLMNNYAGGNNGLTSMTIDGSCMAYFDDDVSSSSEYTGMVTLCSGAVDLTEFVDVYVSFDYLFHTFSDAKSPNNSYFLVEAYDGFSWHLIMNGNDTSCPWYDIWNSACFSSEQINVSSYANENFKIRFTYSDGETGDWAGMAALDNYKIEGTRVLPVLPLDLLSFESDKEENEVVLKWETANEIDVDYYELEHSTDGASFSTIDKLDALNGYSQTYTSVDESPINGINYYRLKMWDLDGSFKHSDIITERFSGTSKGAFDINVFPNPVDDELLFLESDFDLENAQYSILSQHGKLIQHGILKDGTSNRYSLNIRSLSPGIYFLQLVNNASVIKKKIVRL